MKTVLQKQEQKVSTCMDSTLAQLDQKMGQEFFYSISAPDLLIQENCPVCGSTSLHLLNDVALEGLVFFATSTCGDCYHVFRNIMPGCDWFRDRWKQIATSELEVFNPTLEQDRLHRYRMYYTLLSRFKREGSLLDVGAAYGSGVNFFKEKGWSVQALEIEDDRANYIRQKHGIAVHHGTIDELELPKGSLDVILFSHCLEHVDHPRASLEKLASWLKEDGGLLYLEVPILWTVVDWRDAFFMAHKHNFVEEGLHKLVEDCGLYAVEKFLVPDMETGINNLGMLLSRRPQQASAPKTPFIQGDKSVEAVRELYTRFMPAEWHVDARQPVHYHVPYINHFYYIVRMQQGAFMPAGQSNQFVFKKA
jgi:SAM-dependent methyltransferase